MAAAKESINDELSHHCHNEACETTDKYLYLQLHMDSCGGRDVVIAFNK